MHTASAYLLELALAGKLVSKSNRAATLLHAHLHHVGLRGQLLAKAAYTDSMTPHTKLASCACHWLCVRVALENGALAECTSVAARRRARRPCP